MCRNIAISYWFWFLYYKFLFNTKLQLVMRKILLLILFNLSILLTWASTSSIQSKSPFASEIKMPLFNTGKFISVEDFMKLTRATYKEIAGKKMRLKERVGLALGKKSLKKIISKDGTVNMEKMEKMKERGLFGSWQWHWGGFALGFFLSILGPIVALFFNDDYKWDRFHTALRTALIVFALIGIVIAAAGA